MLDLMSARLRRVSFVLAGICLGGLAALFVSPALAGGPYLKLIAVVPDPTNTMFPVVADGKISLVDPNYSNYKADFAWSPPPAAMDGSGGSVSLNVNASAVTGGGINIGMGLSSGSFDYEGGVDGGTEFIWAHAGESKSTAATIHFKPKEYLGDGAIVELRIGVYYYGGVTYRYQVSTDPIDLNGHDGDSSSEDDSSSQLESNLAAQIDCPPSITIGAPPLNCHLIISGFRHNTADAVSVRLPNEKDGFGNHDNGIQVFNTEGEQDVFNMEDPYSWGFFVIACPTDSHVGGNCFDFKATGGTTASVPFEVCQANSGCITVDLTFNVLGKSGPTTTTTGPTHYIGNRWASGGFINVENGSPVSGWIKLDWLSARWEFEPVDGTAYFRLKNAWHGDYLNIETGSLQAGQIQPAWQSAMWQFLPVGGNSGYYLIGSVWHPEMFLNVQQNGALVASPVDQGAAAAHWWILD